MDELILGNRIIHLTSLLLAAPVSRTESACALTDAIYAETLQHGERHLRAHWFKLLSWGGGGLMGNLPPRSGPRHFLGRTAFPMVPTRLPSSSFISELGSAPQALLVSSKKLLEGISLAEVGLVI